jgi:polysaccharide export outer membrane protein
VEYSFRGGSPTTYAQTYGAVGGGACEVEIVPVLPEAKSNSRLPVRWSRIAMSCALAAFALLAASLPAKAEYRLDVGDVLDVSVFGIAELRAHARVNMDGAISFPLLGEIQVAGQTAQQLRTKIQSLLAEQVNQHQATGASVPFGHTELNEVTVEIAEYRPIYINGDVAHAGEQTFRPGMTVRHAVLLAGGLDPARGRASSIGSTSQDMQSLWVDYTRENARIWRLDSALADQLDRPKPPMLEVPIPRDLVAQIVGAEADILNTDEVNYTKQLSQLRDAVKDTETQLSLLSDQVQKQKSGLDADTLDLSRIRELSEKNLVTVDRVTEQRHQVFQATTQFLQSSAQLAELRKEKDDYDLRLSKLTADRHVALVGELEEDHIKLAALRERLQAAGGKLIAASPRGQQVDQEEDDPSIVVFRHQDQTSTRLTATEDTTLLPGDVVQVSLRTLPEAGVVHEEASAR